MSKAPKPPIEIPPIAIWSGSMSKRSTTSGITSSSTYEPQAPLSRSCQYEESPPYGKDHHRRAGAEIGERLEHRLDQVAALVLAPSVQEDDQRPVLGRRPRRHHDPGGHGALEQLALDRVAPDLDPEGAPARVVGEHGSLDEDRQGGHRHGGEQPQDDREDRMGGTHLVRLGGRDLAHAATVAIGVPLKPRIPPRSLQLKESVVATE